MSDPVFPVIRLEVERIKFAMLSALSEASAQIDEDIHKAVEDYMQPENVSAIVHTIATSEIDAALKREVEWFFRYGNGRDAIRSAVNEKLNTFDKIEDKP